MTYSLDWIDERGDNLAKCELQDIRYYEYYAQTNAWSEWIVDAYGQKQTLAAAWGPVKDDEPINSRFVCTWCAASFAHWSDVEYHLQEAGDRRA